MHEVKRFIANNAPEMLTVFALGGILPKKVMELEPDMFLMPITELPPSLQRNQAMGLIRGGPLQMPPLRPWPTAAIAIKYKWPSAVRRGAPTQEWAKTKSDHDTRLTETQLCLAVACKGVVDLIAGWSQPAEASTPAIFPHAAWSTSGLAPRRPAKQFDQDEVQQVVDLFLRFRGGRETLHVPLERLNSAMAQVKIVDRCIDLGIALEPLLMHETAGGERSDNQELRFKIGIRGAWLRGGNAEERQDHFVLLRTLYDLRSGAVHSGRISRADATKVLQQLDAGEDICIELLRRILEMGQWPDWNKLILGVGAGLLGNLDVSRRGS